MKQIPAWQSEDGKQFFTEAECKQHEANKLFSAWYYLGHSLEREDSDEVFYWLTDNAEDIRGFLPPVAAKPELNIDDLIEEGKYYHDGGMKVRITDVEKWLAGELE